MFITIRIVFEAAIMDLAHTVWSDSIRTNPVRLLDLEYISLAIGITFALFGSWVRGISGLEATILATSDSLRQLFVLIGC